MWALWEYELQRCGMCSVGGKYYCGSVVGVGLLSNSQRIIISHYISSAALESNMCAIGNVFVETKKESTQQAGQRLWT